MVIFYPGIFELSHAKYFPRCMINMRRLKKRKSPFACDDWIMDSGAFTEVAIRGGYQNDPEVYADEINRVAQFGGLTAAVSQDWMCEPFVVEKTGLSVRDHQHMTIERYDRIVARVASSYVMPVLQGYSPRDYQQHINDYGDRLSQGAWVGVGSVCKRNGSPRQVADVLLAIASVRPDLRLHGFGVKLTALRDGDVRRLLYSADSMAWSFSARMKGRDQNDWREAMHYTKRVEAMIASESQASLGDGWL